MPRIYTRREMRNRKMKLQIYAGMYDFVSTIVGGAVVIACVVLFSSLISWVESEGVESFATLFDILKRSIIMPE